ncbi:MAG: urease accessory protein UreF [Verrucomicrobia bacterium]|jgi:urease accessory protein|nr:urease accessory protein UreF [Verrucomicrobiota bacterium]
MMSEPATNTDDHAWLLRLLQAGDSFYPTGSYAHSFGLEALVQDGVIQDRASLRQFLFLSVLPALRQAELPLAAHAWRALAGPDWKAVGELCVLSSALKAPRELRLASEQIGRQRAELLAQLHPGSLAATFCREAAENRWPGSAAVSAALEGRVAGAPLPAVLSGVYYSAIAALLSAGMKLLRLGQNGAQTLLSEALAPAPAILSAATVVPVSEVGWFNPWLDIAAARHEFADARMFIS